MPRSFGATLRHRHTKLHRKDTTELSKGSRFLDLPLELRHYIYADLIYPGVPGSRSALTVTNRQLREEVHDWLAGQKIIIHVRAWQNEWRTAWPWYAPILKRVTNVEFDLSCLPGHPSYPTLDLLCLWQHECHLEQVNFTLLDDSVPARKCQHGDDRTNFPDTLPSGSNYRAVVKVLVESAAINIRRAIISGRALQIEASLAGQPRTLDALLQGLDSRNIAEIKSATKPVSSIDLVYRLLSTFICSLQTYISNVYAAALDQIENTTR